MTEPPQTVGRYRVERLIAHGGMGSVYLARDPAIDRLVVIKFLKEGFDDTAARERFAREARAAGRLHHPNIVTVFDVGEHEDRPFIAMEYVAGETLAQLVGRRAVRRVWEKLGILEELCAGLHYAHGAAVVHRDVKPANVMVDKSGLVKILDFGIARGGGGGMTGAGDFVGTLNYMSPEQLAGGHVDHRTDVYSVGAVGYELITSQMAFPGTVQTGVLFKILNSGPVPMEDLVPEIDPDIPAIIARAMAREPAERYPDLETLRQDLSVVRARLFETAPDLEEATDPNAETRFDSARIGSGSQPRPSSRPGSARHPSAGVIAARPPGQVVVPPRRRPLVLLGVACATLAVALVATLTFDHFRITGPPVRTDTNEPQQAQPPPPSSAAAPRPNEGLRESVTRSEREQLVSAARATARQQIVNGERQRALDTLIGGLALDEKDPGLNGLLDEMTGAARRTATDARAAAAVRGANPKSSATFRQAQAREREADTLVGAGDRVQAIGAAWAAAALYNRAPEKSGSNASAASSSVPPSRGTREPVESPAPNPVPTAPSLEPLKTIPGASARPSSPVPPPPAAPKPAPATVPREPPPDPRAADLSAIRETLRRYTQAYQALDAAAVGRMMPSLTPDQLRDLARDFSNTRRYTVEIRDERIEVEARTARVTCQVVRSFEPKNGVTESNTVQSIFHLRRSGSGWTIERLESR
jgi:serine/threonine-protein kinase